MWSCSRRRLLLGAFGLGLSACGFTPVYGPQGGGQGLQGNLALADPKNANYFLLNRRIEERLGRANGPALRLDVQLKTDELDMGATSTGNTTRYRVVGDVEFQVVEIASGTEMLRDSTTAFTGYSNTGSTAATLAAEKDAYERLMVILADQMVDHLLLAAPDLLP